ncbi:MAG: hypothetical protein ACR2PA_09070 [Hyphomicrobiaceae bacterium]
MTKRITIGACMAALLLGGCGSVKLPSLSTGSIGGQTQTAAATPAQAQQAPEPDDPVNRALHVGVTVARAQKCGYFFDPIQLKTNYFAAEAVRYPAPEIQQKFRSAYEFGRLRVSRKIADQADFCTGERTKAIQTSLTRYLAGDYTAPKKKKVAESSGWFDLSSETPEKKWNPNDAFGDKYSRQHAQ